jgi:hypothetical protein
LEATKNVKAMGSISAFSNTVRGIPRAADEAVLSKLLLRSQKKISVFIKLYAYFNNPHHKASYTDSETISAHTGSI